MHFSLNAKQRHFLLLVPGILLVAFMHLWKLTSVPGGFHVDEIAIAYDAKCLSMFGVNRNGISFPFFLPNYGGSQAPLYTYSVSAPFSGGLINLPHYDRVSGLSAIKYTPAAV